MIPEPSSVQMPSAIHGARDDYLRVYWGHAAGDFDFYQVGIKHNNNLIQNRTVPRIQNECIFTGLEPGRLYTVIVSTWSGKYVSSASTDGRTCEATILFFSESVYNRCNITTNCIDAKTRKQTHLYCIPLSFTHTHTHTHHTHCPSLL